MAASPARRTHGFTLIELLLVLVVAVLLAGLMLPTYQAQSLRSGRLDAVDALMRLQQAQEQHRNHHGRYAADLKALGPATAGSGHGPRAAGLTDQAGRAGHADPLAEGSSPRGLYSLSLTRLGADGYRATASARGRQLGDGDCPELTLEVNGGYPTEGPNAGCWQR